MSPAPEKLYNEIVKYTAQPRAEQGQKKSKQMRVVDKGRINEEQDKDSGKIYSLDVIKTVIRYDA